MGSVFAVPASNERRDAEQVARVGLLLSTIGGHAASVTPMSGPRVKGATIDVENPPYPDMAPLPSGSILMRSFYDSTQYAVFLRQDDQRDASLQGNLRVAKDLQVGGASKSKGRVSAGEYLQVGASAVVGEACESEGLLARASDLGLLVCQQGRWQRVDRGNGGGYLELSGYPCFENDDWIVPKRNPKTGDCTCPPGYEPFLMSVWKHPVMSLPNWIGVWRRRLDNVGLWLFYRRVHSLRFLSLLGVILNRHGSAGTRLRHALVLQSRYMSPWLGSHLQSMIQRLDHGASVIDALDSGLIDSDIWWYFVDMVCTLGLDTALERTCERLGSSSLVGMHRQATFLRWSLLLGALSVVLGVLFWHFRVFDELRHALSIQYAY